MWKRLQAIPASIRSSIHRSLQWLAAQWRKLVLLGAITVGGVMLLSLGAIEVTSRPQFCGSCHVMEPYFKSWQSSAHSKIACVECHIPPGVTSELRKKYEALSMVTSYFTGTYGTKPWTNVDEATCLSCHERRLLPGKKAFHNTTFNHTPHMTEMRGGQKLRCTSCHAQLTQGKHIDVVEQNCFICHFKDQTLNEGKARCTICHEIPDKVVTKANLTFDHGEVKRFGMQCTSCHSNVVQGSGEVPPERCNTCHNDPALLARYGETRLLHKAHVTDHKVDCTNCHLEIQHKSMLTAAVAPSPSAGPFSSLMPASSNACGSCHRDGHSAARDLYAGTGGKGLDPMPSKMNQVGIRCEGCHFLPREGLRSTVAEASEVSCMSCHGARYNKILGRWKSLVDSRLQLAKTEFTQARNLFPNAHESGPLADAFANIQLVDRGVGVHNVEYSLALLDASHKLINNAMETRGLKAFAKKWTEAPFESSCFRCHRGIEQQTGRIFGIGFIHKPHIASGFECATCHRPHEDKPAGEVVRFGREGCANCHHQREQQKPEACLRCHSELLTRKVAFKDKQFDHSFHFKDLSQKCADCHLSGGTIRRAPVMKTCEACHPAGFN